MFSSCFLGYGAMTRTRAGWLVVTATVTMETNTKIIDL